MTYAKVDEAIQAAAEWHRGSERDGDHALPYITHPVEVLINLRAVGGVTDEDLLCAAVLHDTLEETPATATEIEHRFGARVAKLVSTLTRIEPTEAERAKLTKSDLWKLRSSMLLKEISEMPAEVQAVKLADRLSNVREAIRTRTGEKLTRYLAQTREILRIVPKSCNPGLWQAIATELERYEKTGGKLP